MKFDSVIFDMDGVIVDVRNSYREAIRQTASFFLKRKVKKEEVDKIKKQVGMNNDWDATYALINNKNIPYNEVVDYFQLKYLGNGNTRGLILKEKLLISRIQLKRLKTKYRKLGIATGRPKKEALFVIKNFNLQIFFPPEYIVALEDTAREKPSPVPLLEAKKRMRVSNPVYVGDTINDIIAAKKADMPCIFIGKEKLGDIQITNIKELEKILS